MILQVCREIRNFFEISSESGKLEIKNGSIAVVERYAVGQYVLITGSILNNGVKRVESFQNGVISFAIPRDEYPVWERPIGTIGLYSAGDNVTHNGERWISLIDNNSWEPGTVGTANLWEHIHDSPEEHTTSDEAFDGTIYGLRIPHDFLVLCDEIQAFIESPAGKPSNYASESVLGLHSWSKAADKNGAPAGWQMIFAQKLMPFRRMFAGVKI